MIRQDRSDYQKQQKRPDDFADQVRHDRRRLRRRVREGRTRCRRLNAGEIDVVLDREWNAIERQAFDVLRVEPVEVGRDFVFGQKMDEQIERRIERRGFF